jgi:hypothetical protein
MLVGSLTIKTDAGVTSRGSEEINRRASDDYQT